MLGKYLKIVFLVGGVSLLGVVLAKTNMQLLLEQIKNIGWYGAAVILLAYSVYFAADSLSWQATIRNVPLNYDWFLRCCAVRMVGEAYNNITPAASMGGEPIKAWLLKANWQVPITESSVALVVSKTTSMFTLVGFVALGVMFSFYHSSFSYDEKQIAALGLLVIITFTLVFFLIQKLKLLSVFANRLALTFNKKSLQKFLVVSEKIDRQFEDFYSMEKIRLVYSAFFASVNWLMGVVEIYLIFYFLGHPLSFQEAWMLECFVQLVRTLTFFIPAGIGTQEGAFFIGAGLFSGVISIGIAAALVRRARDIFWISLSLSILPLFSVKPQATKVKQDMNM